MDIKGTEHNDRIYGSDESDLIDGDLGHDDIHGYKGDDILYGGEGHDTLYGGEGDDDVAGGSGNDYLNSGSGDDILDGESGDDYLEGGLGSDVYHFHLGSGIDAILENDFIDTVSPRGRDVVIFHGITSDQVTSLHRISSDLIIQYSANDKLRIDRFFSNPTYVVENFVFSDAVWDIETIKNTVITLGDDSTNQIIGYDDGPNRIFGLAERDLIYGGSWADHLDGGDGDDVIEGYAGDDVIAGGAGNDNLAGGSGNDTINGGSGNDYILAGDGDDTIEAGVGSDTIFGGKGTDIYIINSQSGIDFIGNHGSFDGDDDIVIFDAITSDQVAAIERHEHDLIIKYQNTNQITIDYYFYNDNPYANTTSKEYLIKNFKFSDGKTWGIADIKSMAITWGKNSGDNIFGYKDGKNNIFSLDGNDTIRGGDLDDQINGGGDDDIIYGHAGNDSLYGGTGADRIDGNEGADSIAGEAGNDTLTGGTGDDIYMFSLGDGQDTISAESDTRINRLEKIIFASNVTTESVTVKLNSSDLELSIANDSDHADKITIQGFYTHSDSSNASNPVQQVVFSATNEIWNLAKLTELAQASLVITGTDNADELNGTDAADKIDGLAGDDTLNGGFGADTLNGGLGDDTYWVDDANDITHELENEGYDTVNTTLSWTLGSHLERLYLVGEAINGTGNALANLIIGNEWNNRLEGLDGNDTLDNYWGGADTLIGGTGHDLYIINSPDAVVEEWVDGGFDWIQSYIDYTASANVEGIMLIGSNSADIVGNSLDNSLYGNNGNNRMTGGAGDDLYWFRSGDGQDTISSEIDTRSGRKETLIFDGGLDPSKVGMRLQGSSLVLNIIGTNDSVTIEGFVPNNAVNNTTCSVQWVQFQNWGTLKLSDWAAGLLANTVTGDAGNNALNGTGGADRIYGLAGNDTLTGNAGNDTLDGGAGTDKMSGGTGDDLYLVDNASDTVAENTNEGADLIRSEVSYTAPTNVENLTLTGTANLNATGNAQPNVLTGNSGNNALDGAAGADTLVGGAGNDTYTVDAAGDVVVELADQGADTIRSAVTYTASANIENLTLTGSAAVNATGNALDNTLTGNGGNNVLDGGAGNDTMVGDKGNDTYIVDASGDVVTEGTGMGTDLIQASVSYTASLNVENLTLTGSAAINATGNALINTLTGNGADNVLDGGAGADKLIGGAGNDTYVVDIAGDAITETIGQGTDLILSAVSYTASANVENLTLTGTAANKATGNTLDNTLTGNSGNNALDGGTAGNDTLDGGAGNDTLTGGVGADLLTGGAGNDLFVFAAGSTVLTIGGSGNAGPLAGYDRISDFALGFVTGAQDKIDTIGTPVVVANTAGVNGIDSKLTIAGQAIKSHAIKDGMITFDDADTYATPLSLGSLSDVAAVVQYLQGNNLGKAGASVAFDADTGGVHHTFLFTQGDAAGKDGLDVLVDLVGIDASRLAAATAGMTASTLLIG